MFQAPFKDNCYYFPGLELIIRLISFVVGSMFLTTAHERLAFDNCLCVFLLVYLCAFKPFKCFTNTVLYISYVLNIECVIILQIYSNLDITENYYIVIFHSLVIIALAKFAVTILYYLYINQLQKIKQLKLFVAKLSSNWSKCYSKLKDKPIRSPTLEQNGDHEHLQEELLYY